MDNAKLVEYNLDITLGCPKCDCLFQLSNYSIPTEVSTYQVCDNCQVPLEVKPISIKIKFKKPTKLKEVKEKVVVNLLEDGKEDAKNIIKSYGFKVREIDNVLNALETDGMAIETIVKEVLARIDKKYEQAKT